MPPTGLLYGLGAAVAWGITDISSALAGRRVGSLGVLVGAQTIGLVVLVVIAVLRGVDPWSMPTSTLVYVTGLGILGGVAYLTFFTALRIGPVAVVSPVVAAFGGLTVVLAVIFRGETLEPLQALGAILATAGIVMTGVVLDGGLRGIRLRGAGVAFALVALTTFAVLTVGTAGPIKDQGWLEVTLVTRGADVVFAFSILALIMARRPVWSRTLVETGGVADGRGPLLVLASGLLDVIGLISFAIGLEVAETWLVGLASSFGPAVAVLVAVAFLHERLRPVQWLGLLALGLGMVAIAVA
jgi:drug/metabolite transporter (DMT)-like permease